MVDPRVCMLISPSLEMSLPRSLYAQGAETRTPRRNRQTDRETDGQNCSLYEVPFTSDGASEYK
eukprot:4968744-Ditylum_brightwellii.AAC.1